MADRSAALRAAAIVPQPQNPGSERPHPGWVCVRLPRGRVGETARGRDRQTAVRGRVRAPGSWARCECKV